eukprot:7383347-Prymnesium_polylepis.1
MTPLKAPNCQRSTPFKPCVRLPGGVINARGPAVVIRSLRRGRAQWRFPLGLPCLLVVVVSLPLIDSRHPPRRQNVIRHNVLRFCDELDRGLHLRAAERHPERRW